MDPILYSRMPRHFAHVHRSKLEHYKRTVLRILQQTSSARTLNSTDFIMCIPQEARTGDISLIRKLPPNAKDIITYIVLETEV